MADFNNLEPKTDVTDPKRLGANRDYPAHVHAKDGSYVVVFTDAEKAARLDEGYTLQPTHAMWTEWTEKKPMPAGIAKAKGK